MPANTEINPHNWIVIEKKDRIFFVHYYWILIPLNAVVLSILFICTEYSIHIKFEVDTQRGARRRTVKELSKALKKHESKIMTEVSTLPTLLKIRGGKETMFDILSRCVQDGRIYMVRNKKLAKTIKKLFKRKQLDKFLIVSPLVAGTAALITASGPYEVSIFRATIWNLSIRKIEFSILASVVTYLFSVIFLNQCPAQNFLVSLVASLTIYLNMVDCQGVLVEVPQHAPTPAEIVQAKQSKQLIPHRHYIDDPSYLNRHIFINSGNGNKLYSNSGEPDICVNVEKNLQKSTSISMEFVSQKEKNKVCEKRFRKHKNIPLSQRTKTMSDLKKEYKEALGPVMKEHENKGTFKEHNPKIKIDNGSLENEELLQIEGD